MIQVLSSKVGWRIKRRRLAGIVEILIRDPSSLLQPITSYCIQPCRDTTDPGKLVQALLPLLQLHHISLQPDTSSSQTQPWPAFWVLFCSWSCAWSLLSAPGLLRVRFLFPASQLLALESQVTDSWQTMKFSVFKTKSPSTKAATLHSTPSLE